MAHGDATIRQTLVDQFPACHRNAPFIGALLTFLFLLPATTHFPQFWRLGFCYPVARATAAFLGVPCAPTDEGFTLPTPEIAIHVTLACSAGRYFVLILALLVREAIHAGLRPRFWLALPLAAYLITMAANTMRIVMAWLAARLAAHALPVDFQPAVHTAAGVFVFLSVLIVVHVVISRSVPHADR